MKKLEKKMMAKTDLNDDDIAFSQEVIRNLNIY